jgi:hypothetical protein
VAALCPGPGIFARLVEFGLDPAFAVLFLRSQNLPHQGSVARLVLYARIVAGFSPELPGTCSGSPMA